MERTNEQIAMRVSLNTIIWNAVLTAFKLAAGILAHSAAMLSDAVHTLSDVLSTVVVMIGIKVSSKTSDKDHPYGHVRMECVAAIILAGMLFFTGAAIGWSSFQSITSGNYGDLSVPGILALAAAVISIAVKEIMYWYTRAVAKKTDSGALMADAWHHRSDALSSIGSFVGILGARLGFPILDPAAGFVICIFILKAAFDIFMDSIKKMTDNACDDKIIGEIREVILEQESVAGIDNIKTRMFGNKIYADIEISVDGSSSLYDAHNTAHRVHDAIEARLSKVKHCMIHVNPTGGEDKEASTIN